jgi:hypothetical protein
MVLHTRNSNCFHTVSVNKVDVSSLEINLSLTFFFSLFTFVCCFFGSVNKEISYFYYTCGYFYFSNQFTFHLNRFPVSSKFSLVYVKCETSNIFIVGSVDRH